MGKGGEPSVGKVGLGVAKDGVKRRRVSCKQINKLWQGFLEMIRQNKGGRKTKVVRVDKGPTKVYSQVYCPFGNDAGGDPCPKCFENMLLQSPRKFERRKLLTHLRKMHPDLASSYGVALKETDVCDEDVKKSSEVEEPSELKDFLHVKRPSHVKISLGTKDNKKEKESDAEGEDDIIIIGSYDD
ncbi:hypothetical protein PSENEW3n2_00003878 [Picochlorum sp. SENEW3]|nr:hypothetical protein PSENEW3n2_00003878 [Picochlorum sp. SENEW3]WPT18578.1 hypothetical protein PSENEW3_00003878 [Picochlorum sp. SENEW3]